MIRLLKELTSLSIPKEVCNLPIEEINENLKTVSSLYVDLKEKKKTYTLIFKRLAKNSFYLRFFNCRKPELLFEYKVTIEILKNILSVKTFKIVSIFELKH